MSVAQDGATANSSQGNDVNEIRRLLTGVNRAFDDGDEAAWLAAFDENAILESSTGLLVHGTEQLSAFFRLQAHETVHIVTDSEIDVELNVARHTANFVVFGRVDGEPRPLVIGRYNDCLTRTPRGWRLSRRTSESR
jgi:ketosteroid isomerase-like protein